MKQKDKKKWKENIVKKDVWYEKTYDFGKHSLRKVAVNFDMEKNQVSVLTEVFDPRTNQNYFDDIKSFDLRDIEFIMDKAMELQAA